MEGVDVEALRTFVAVAETGQFQAAADELGISQQAVSKRVAALERHVEVPLLVRTSRGSRLSLDGQVFLPHAKKVLAAVEQAEQAVRPGSRPLRVDVLNRRISPARAVYRFYRSHPGTDLDTVTLSDKNAAQAAHAVLEGTIDASFRALPADQVPAGISAERLLDSPLEAPGRTRPPAGRRALGQSRGPGRPPHLDSRDQARHGVGGVLPGDVRDLRPEYRRARPPLR